VRADDDCLVENARMKLPRTTRIFMFLLMNLILLRSNMAKQIKARLPAKMKDTIKHLCYNIL
jgi:hypothetical protein